MKLNTLFDNLTTRFGVLQNKLNTENKVSKLDLNVLMETTALWMLNEVYGYNLVNANLISKNYPGIDGVDVDRKIMVQVTKTFSVEKILHTLDQIEKNKLNSTFDELYFFFLDDTRTLQNASIDKIRKNTPQGIRFDPKRDLLDSNSLFTQIYQTQNVKSALALMNILEEVLGIIPDEKSLGFEAIGLTFESELENAYIVVDEIIRLGYNVYVSSKELYEQFVLNGHGFLDYLLLVDAHTNLEHIKYSIVLVSPKCIEKQLSLAEPSCPLLRQALNNELGSRIQLVSFNTKVDREAILNKEFRTWKQLTKWNIGTRIREVIDEMFDDGVALFLEIDETIRELRSIYGNFDFKVLQEEGEAKYCLLQRSMDDHPNFKMYYLLLANNYVLQDVKEHLRRHFFQINPQNITVLAPKDPLQKTNNRLTRIKNELGVEKVHYVAEHLFEKTLKKEKQLPILNTQDFVDPIIRGKTEEDGIEGINNWVSDKGKSPIAVIIGPGGIGKTTFCKKIHDLLISKKEAECHVIFINSNELLSEFQHVDFSDEFEYSVYSLYKRWHEKSRSQRNKLIPESSFLANFQLGNILVIFDGVDELISTIPDFTLSKFLDNVNRYETNIGKGKILINIRDGYFQDFKNITSQNELEVFELLPFSEDLARKYFEQHFVNKPRKVEKCMALLNVFVNSENSGGSPFRYPPFVVEIVRVFAEKEAEGLQVDHTFESEILDQRQMLDVIVFRTCLREIVKKEEHGFPLPVDKQVELFMEVACSSSASFRVEGFVKLLRNINCVDRLNEVAKTHGDHPFLKPSYQDTDLIVFRFDFLTQYFKALRFDRLLSSGTLITSSEDLKFIANELEPNSLVTKNLLERKKESYSVFYQSINSIIKGIVNSEEPNNSVTKSKAISNLFLMSINMGVKDIRTIIEENFVPKRHDNIVKGLCLIDVPDQLNILMDFSGLCFSDCVFDGYTNLLYCNYDEESFFDELCTVKRCKPTVKPYMVVTAQPSNFDSALRGDNSIHQFFQDGITINDRYATSMVVDSLKAYFRCFYDGSSLRQTKMEREVQTNYRYAKGKAEFSKVNSVLIEEGIVHQNSGKLSLAKPLRAKVDAFVHQGLNFGELNTSIEKILER